MTTPQSEAALLPCPFPHEGCELFEEAWPAKGWYWVHCPCGATGPRVDSPEKARESWNKRSTSEARAALADANEKYVNERLEAIRAVMHQDDAWKWVVPGDLRLLVGMIDRLRTLPASQPTGMEDSRKEFEREAKAWGLKLQRHTADCGPFKTGEYVHEKTFDMWLAWQAARQPGAERLTEQDIEIAVGGAYEIPDGRKFWNDPPVAREIARRVWRRMHQK